MDWYICVYVHVHVGELLGILSEGEVRKMFSASHQPLYALHMMRARAMEFCQSAEMCLQVLYTKLN